MPAIRKGDAEISLAEYVADMPEGSRVRREYDAHLQALIEYGEHNGDCPLARFEAGRPKEGGGYEMRFAGKWYEVRPRDKSPKCTCGLADALDAYKEAVK